MLQLCCSSDKQRNRHFIRTKNIQQDIPHAHAPIRLCCVRNYDKLHFFILLTMAPLQHSVDRKTLHSPPLLASFWGWGGTGFNSYEQRVFFFLFFIVNYCKLQPVILDSLIIASKYSQPICFFFFS